jgi:hypothetical protein
MADTSNGEYRFSQLIHHLTRTRDMRAAEGEMIVYKDLFPVTWETTPVSSHLDTIL